MTDDDDLSIFLHRMDVVVWLKTSKPPTARIPPKARKAVADFREMCRAIADEPSDAKVLALALELDRLCIEPSVAKILTG